MVGLDSQISDSDADGLLRIAIIQAIENARAYCRNFDDLTASQQMALTQLVYQMGVNLGEFDHFLALINNNPDPSLVSIATATPATALLTAPVNALSTAPTIAAATAAVAPVSPPPNAAERWSAIQASLEQSQWARLYRSRAVAVIAMLDPRYADSPSLAERRIAATLHPAVAHRRRHRSSPSLRAASTARPPQPHARAAHAAHGRRKV